jgi:GR25 family glycosyltransferase involved in LPS biosynthesis
MSNNPISQYYVKKALPTWKDHNVHLFEAITPKTLPRYDKLNFKMKMSKGGAGVEFSPTEKAVWYSHFLLWKNCVTMNRKIIVIEHDVHLVDPLPKERFREKNGLALCKIWNKQMKRHVCLPAGAYYMTPYIAQVLINYTTKDPNGIQLNVDAYLKKMLDTESHNWCCESMPEAAIGSTIIHNKNGVHSK